MIEIQRNGNTRADYRKRILKSLSEGLTKEFVKGYSEDTLSNARKFYISYGDRISETVFRKLENSPFKVS